MSAANRRIPPAVSLPPSGEAVPPSKQAEEERPRFRDSGWALALVVAAVLFLRWFIFQPFKIPSGSMEPTLIGHEDYGDRIWMNALSYKSAGYCLAVLGGALTLIVAGWIAARGWLRRRYTVLAGTAVVAVLLLAFVLKLEHAAAEEPHRYDVVVFLYDNDWERIGDRPSKPEKKNYIKRLIGLPGETVVISGGDLFLLTKRQNNDGPPETSLNAAGEVVFADGRPRILRKPPAIQEQLWLPVSEASFAWPAEPTAAELRARPWAREIKRDERFFACPWKITPASDAKVEYPAGTLRLRGTVALEYAVPVENVYVKMGRWPFQHLGCPAAHREVEDAGGVKLRDPRFRHVTEYIRPYITHVSRGVRCPNCGRLLFPLSRRPKNLREDAPVIVPDATWSRGERKETEGRKEQEETGTASSWFGASADDLPPTAAPRGTRFFYGGYNEVGDLKLEVELEVERAGGTLTLEVGSDRCAARWTLSPGRDDSTVSGKDVAAGRDRERKADGASRSWREVRARPALSVGRHVLSLAYVDATVIAVLDGREVERRELNDVGPLGLRKLNSLARLRFDKVRVTVRHLRLYRDVYYTLFLDGEEDVGRIEKSDHDRLMTLQENGCYIACIPQGRYMMLGDNSPSSKDSRVWGFVPRKNLMGRASFIWWPPGRLRILR